MPAKFSYYKGGIKKTVPTLSITIAEAVEMIGSEKYKEDIERLRKASDDITRSVLKSGLDYFTFSGTFKKRLNDSIIKHSGLIGLDLDEIDNLLEAKSLICADEHVICCFVSPSGNGLKVIIPIDGNLHIESFRSLQVYFREKFNIELDKGVNDVTRACFVSYDPEIFYNPKAKKYKVKDVPTEVKKDAVIKEINSSEITAIAKKNYLERLKYVIQQIEEQQIDITSNDYNDRLMVGFSLSTLGEEAREYYHKAVQYNDAYTPKDADEKFDNALKTSKFKRPSKFFALAKDFGLKTEQPKTIAEKKEEVDIKDIIGDEDSASDYIKFGLWEQDGTYWSLDPKGKKYNISNFVLRILYHVQTSDQEAYRMIEIKNVWGVKKVVQMNTDDFVSVGSFKKIVARQGNFIFKGTDVDLCRLQDKLQRDELPTEFVEKLGYHKRGNFYAFANGIYDLNKGEFVPADDQGIVQHYRVKADEMLKQNYFIPALSSMYKDKDNMFMNDKRFVFVPSSHTFAQWAELYCKSYGNVGKLAVAWYVAALFSDIIFDAMDDRFPMLFVYGQKGTGKGTMLESLMKMFGPGQKQLMLGGASTVVGFMRKSGQYVNALVWFDEYKNNVKTQVRESIKNLYDRKGYERGKKDNSMQTESTSVDSGIVVSGQEMPTGEEALFTRFILLTKLVPDKSDTVRKAFDQLKHMEKDGLSQITVDLLNMRPLFKEEFKSRYKSAMRDFEKELKNADIIDRMINNYACLITVVDMVLQKFKLPFTLLEFKNLCRKLIEEQFFVLKGSDTVGKFWSIVEALFEQDYIKEDKHFKLSDGKLYIRIQDIYQFYAELMNKRRDDGMLDHATLRNYLEHNPQTYIETVRKSFGGSYKWCMVFKYQELGIDLIRRENKSELLKKYREMGMEITEADLEYSAQEKAHDLQAMPVEPTGFTIGQTQREPALQTDAFIPTTESTDDVGF
jgi:hypothetical protein